MLTQFKYIGFFFIFSLISCQSNTPERRVFQKDLMYTTFDIVIYSQTPKFLLSGDINSIWKEIAALEYDLSPAGEGFLGQLNGDGFISETANPKIFTIVSNFITLSKDINQKSDGAFDLTVYPLIRLWGFYAQDAIQKVPSSQEIIKALKMVSMDNIIFTNKGIQLLNGAQIDIGAIAKGYAVDVAIEMLKSIPSISAGFVNAGGNIRVYGTKPNKTPWKVGIRDPKGTSHVEEIISLYDGDAIATSGDYEQYFIAEDGTYYHHIFNPKTGRPVNHPLSSMSVVLKGGAESADVLATTFLSMGKEKTLKLLPIFAGDREVSLFFIEREGENLLSEANDAWLKRK